jgi:hypothetical protein
MPDFWVETSGSGDGRRALMRGRSGIPKRMAGSILARFRPRQPRRRTAARMQ